MGDSQSVRWFQESDAAEAARLTVRAQLPQAPRLSKCDRLRQAPSRAYSAAFRGRGKDCRSLPTEPQLRDGFQAFAETIRQPGTTSHLHPGRQIKALHVRRTDLLRIGHASYHVFLDSADVTWGVAMRSVGQG